MSMICNQSWILNIDYSTPANSTYPKNLSLQRLASLLFFPF